MERTIKIDDKHSVRLNNNLAWMMIYREQTGKDVMADLYPVLDTVLALAWGVLQQMEGEKITLTGLKSVDRETLEDVVATAAGFEMTTLIDITWALAKCADDDIEEPKVWIRQFEVFPLDTILPEVFNLILEGSLNSKNLKRLRQLRESLRPASMESSSQDSPEA